MNIALEEETHMNLFVFLLLFFVLLHACYLDFRRYASLSNI